MIEAVEKGAELVGGLGKLATALGIKHQAFYSWKKVPAERALDFERITGISRHVLRPDIFGPSQDADSVSSTGADVADPQASAPAFSERAVA